MVERNNLPSGGQGAIKGDQGQTDINSETQFFTPDGTMHSRQKSKAIAESGPSAPDPATVSSERPQASPQPSSGPDTLKTDAKPKSRHESQTAEDHADELAEAIHAKFMNLLRSRVLEKGGHLTIIDVKEMGEELKQQMGEIKEVFLKAVETFTKSHEKKRQDNEREDAFHRALIQKFDHLMEDDITLPNRPDGLSRRMLPGFNLALSAMIGPEKMDVYTKQIERVTKRLKSEQGDVFDWDDVYKDADVRKLLLLAEIDIAKHFTNIDKRMDWLLAIINSNMIPIEEGRPSHNWVLKESAARKLLTHLFSDMRASLTNTGIRQLLIKQLGLETVEVLNVVSNHFKK